MARRNQHPEDLKARVRKTGISLADLARRHKLHSSTVRNALYTPIPAGNKAIAAYLGETMHGLWPEWYEADESRVPGTSYQPISAGRLPHRQKRCAA